MKAIDIAGRVIGPGQPCFIVAEAGVNHNGDLEVGKRLIEVAACAGADAVKFQSFNAEHVVSASAPKAEYQLRLTDPGESQLGMLRRLELSPDAQRELRMHCEKVGVLFLSTPFDEESADLLDRMGVRAFKVGSGELTNWPYLESMGRRGKPVILSTGMSYLSEVDEAVRVLRHAGCEHLILLHCVSEYPAEPAEANLRAIRTLEVAFQVPVGFSDHTQGIEVALAAVALGACVIEKHFTLDHGLPGPDHRASLDPEELRRMIGAIRTVERALGDGVKRPAKSELRNREVVRRSLSVVTDIPEGAVLQPDMLEALRPATGISPTLLRLVVGRKARRSLRAGQLLAWGDLD